MDFNQMLNKPLTDFHVEKWFQVRRQLDQQGNVDIIGNFSDEKLAYVMAEEKKAKVKAIFVLTKNGKTGYEISHTQIKKEADDCSDTVRAAILNKLSPAEAKFIGVGEKENE